MTIYCKLGKRFYLESRTWCRNIWSIILNNSSFFFNRFGKKYGFNFNDHYNERVGVLRAFVKKYKNKTPQSGDDDKHGKKNI